MTTTPNGQADVIGGNSLRIDRLPGSATIARRWEPTISQASAVSFRALLAFTFVLLVAPQLLFPALRPLRLAMICAVIAIGSYILGRASRGGPLSVHSPELGAGAALAAWAIVTVPFSLWPAGFASASLCSRWEPSSHLSHTTSTSITSPGWQSPSDRLSTARTPPRTSLCRHQRSRHGDPQREAWAKPTRQGHEMGTRAPLRQP